MKLTFPEEWGLKADKFEEGVEEISAGTNSLAARHIMESLGLPMVEIRTSGSKAHVFSGDDLQDILDYARSKWRDEISVRMIANGREVKEFSLTAKALEAPAET